MDLISVIVPFFNSEKTLGFCIDSITNQTYKKIELLLIDDGSKDASVVICNKYIEKDKRITLIKKDNGGVSSARNLGIKNAKGKYIIFVDSDDTLSPDHISTLLETLNKTNSDVAICNYNICSDNKRIKNKFCCINEKDLKGDISQDYYYIDHLLMSPCLAVYKLEIIKENQILFDPKFSYGEDHLFNLMYWLFIDKYCYTNHYTYNYFKGNTDSLSQARSLNGYQCFIKRLKIEKQLLDLKKVQRKNIIITKRAIGGLLYFFLLNDSCSLIRNYKFFIKRVEEVRDLLYKDLFGDSYSRKLVVFLIKNRNYKMLYIIFAIKHFKLYYQRYY